MASDNTLTYVCVCTVMCMKHAHILDLEAKSEILSMFMKSSLKRASKCARIIV